MDVDERGERGGDRDEPGGGGPGVAGASQDEPNADRLQVPPSQRYVRTARTEPGSDPKSMDDEPSGRRGVILAGGVAAFCGAIIVVLGGAFGFTAGLIVVAFFLGRLTAVGMRVGAGSTVSESRRLAASVGISLLAVLLAQVGLWLWARAEGGALGPVDFLAETYGVLVLLELLLAGGAAWLKAS